MPLAPDRRQRGREHVRAHWDEALRLAVSVRAGTIAPRECCGSWPPTRGRTGWRWRCARSGASSAALHLDWLRSRELRRRAHAGLNKGEARNALARAVFFHRLGELRDRTFENQAYRASGLNLLVAAIILWNTRYLQRAFDALEPRRGGAARADPPCRPARLGAYQPHRRLRLGPKRRSPLPAWFTVRLPVISRITSAAASGPSRM